MEIQAIKLELIKMLLEMDEVKVLEKVRDVLLLNGSHRKEEDDEIVGYIGDKPITRIDLLNKIEEGEEAIINSASKPKES